MSEIPFSQAETNDRDRTKNSIYFVEGDNFFTRCMVDYFIARGWNSQFILVEADANIDDISLSYPNPHHDNCEKAYFTDCQLRAYEGDTTINRIEEGSVIANLPLNTRWQLNSWIDRLSLLSIDFREKYLYRIVYFYVSNGSYRSIKQFLMQLDKYPMDKLYQCLVFDTSCFSNADNLEYLEEYQPLMQIIKTYQVPVLAFPKLNSAWQFECEEKNLSYRKLGAGKSIAIQQEITDFSERLDLLYGQIFPSTINDPQGLMKIAEAQKDYSNLKKAFFGENTTVLL